MFCVVWFLRCQRSEGGITGKYLLQVLKKKCNIDESDLGEKIVAELTGKVDYSKLLMLKVFEFANLHRSVNVHLRDRYFELVANNQFQCTLALQCSCALMVICPWLL